MRQFGDWEMSPHLAVACSGGADSLALTLLGHKWVRERGGQITALIVDHGLRAESADEARQVAVWLQDQNINHEILSLHLQADTAIQEMARTARYEALEKWCAEHDVRHLLLGHHADDQIETFLFRLLRGSGPDGLAAMSALREREQVRLLRPLLWIHKQDCIDYLESQNQPWMKDPSNQNARFARVRMREFLRETVSDQQRKRLLSIIGIFGRIRARSDLLFSEIVPQYASLEEAGYGWLTPSDEPSVTVAILKRLLVTINGDDAVPRQQEVEQLVVDLRKTPQKTRSLHRCLIIPQESRWLVVREPERTEANQPLRPNTTICWDKRFQVQTSADVPADCQIGALGEAGVRWLKEQAALPNHLHHLVIRSFPVIWRLEEPVFVPHIRHQSELWPENACRIRFAPAKALAEAPFFTMNKPTN